MYLEQGVDEERSKALAVAFYNLLFGSDHEFPSIARMIERGKTYTKRTQIGDHAMQIAKNFGSALGHLAYSGIRGANTAVSNLSPAAAEPTTTAKMVTDLREHSFELADAIQSGKSNVVEKLSFIVANKTNLVLNTIEKSGYPGSEGVGDVFRRAVLSSSSNPSLEATRFSNDEFNRILNDLNEPQ